MRRLATADLLSVLHSTLIENVTGGGRSHEQARQDVDKWLKERTGAPAQQQPPHRPDPATWGLLPEHQAAMNKAMGMSAGGGS